MPDDETVPLDASPGARVAEAVRRFGEAEVADRAASLLAGNNEGPEFLLWAGGRHAQGVLDGAPPLYWPEVWGARTLLYAWDDSLLPAVRAGLTNQAWRVREMCLRVVAARSLPLAEDVAPLLRDESARVRENAARTLGVVGRAGDIPALEAALRDPEIEVRRQAGPALATLREASAEG